MRRVLHIGKYLPPFAGGMEYFLWDLLHAQWASGLEAAALVHHERAGWHRVLPAADDRRPVYRAPCLGRLMYVPLAPTFPLWLGRAITRHRPDVLHLHLPNSSALAVLALAQARRIPWVIHWHSDLVASALDRRLALAYRLYRPLEQGLLRRSGAIIATSPPYLAASAALRPWRDRCQVVPLGLEPTRLRAPSAHASRAAEQLWQPNRLRVLTIGRLTYYKGHEVLVQAMAAAPDAQAVIVGSGELGPHLRDQIAALALGERVVLRGGCSDTEVAALLHSCDVLCLPSIERTEAFGLVLLEAMRFRKPVVVSAIPGSGTGWVVEQAQNGLTVEPGNPARLAQALEDLQRNPERRWRLGANGGRALNERFRIARVANEIDRLYTEVLGEAMPTHPSP
jgi:rhamnosyl/mannosyltransferase